MVSFAFLDVILVLFFIYFVFSLVVSALQELVATNVDGGKRALLLKEWLDDIFGKDNPILKNGLVSSLIKKNRTPSYIPSSLFSKTLLAEISKITGRDSGAYTIAEIREGLKKVSFIPKDLSRHFIQVLEEAELAGKDGIEAVTHAIELWFEQASSRLSGTYTKWAKRNVLIISAIVVVGSNLDTIELMRYLNSHSDQTAAAAARVVSLVNEKNTADSLAVAGDSSLLKGAREYYAEVSSMSLPLGWNIAQEELYLNPKGKDHSILQDESPKALNYLIYGLLKLFGLGISAFALSFGAPFWFETLNKVVNLRGAGPKPKTESEINKENK
jgi:hypothetical protein